MKKQLLIASLTVLSLSSTAWAQDPMNPGEPNHSENLTLDWYGVPTGTATDANSARSGIGANGKFYVILQNKGVEVYDRNGKIKQIDNATAWVSINCDDAGNVYFRNDNAGWPGSAGAGWYMSNDARFCVIDSKTDVVVASNVKMNGLPQCRFDALPHVRGNMVDGFVSIPVIHNGAGNIGHIFLYDKLGTPSIEQFETTEVVKKMPSPANGNQTLSMAMNYGEGDGDFLAVYANPHMNVTSWLNGYGNGIAKYEYNEDDLCYKWTGKYFNTPNHSSVGGFMMFSYNGKYYILYPAGQLDKNTPAGDGFFVMEEELVDAPTNTQDAEETKVELHKAVAYKYAASGITSGNNWRGLNIEPIEGEDGKFKLYFFNPGRSMQVWTLDLSGSAGINDIVADKAEAKIFGGIGEIAVSGAEKAQVYTPAGQLVGEGTGTIAVAAGLYIVKAGNTTAKVIVK